jgi:hypothetical protein
MGMAVLHRGVIVSVARLAAGRARSAGLGDTEAGYGRGVTSQQNVVALDVAMHRTVRVLERAPHVVEH